MAQLHSLSKELSRQADTRAKIDVKRTEITRKSDLSAKMYGYREGIIYSVLNPLLS